MPIRVNVSAKVNNATIRREQRNGRDVVIVPSYTMPDNVVMNSVLYPAEHIANSFASLNDRPAPLGHPVGPDGEWLSASHPEALNSHYIGAWNANAKRENGRVYLEKIIDVEVASRTEGGKQVLAAIENGEPIHTSTGLLCNVSEAPEGSAYKWVASDITFDHDAILLDEVGAATPEQGVGMLVNSKIEGGVINSRLDEAMDEEIDYLGTRMIEVMRRREDAGLWSRVKEAVVAALAPERAIANSKKEAEMTVEEQVKALSEQVNSLSVVADELKEAKEQIEALNAKLEAQTQANAEAEQAERETLAEKIVNAGLIDEDAVADLPLKSLRSMANKVKPGRAAPLVNGRADPETKLTFTVPE